MAIQRRIRAWGQDPPDVGRTTSKGYSATAPSPADARTLYATRPRWRMNTPRIQRTSGLSPIFRVMNTGKGHVQLQQTRRQIGLGVRQFPSITRSWRAPAPALATAELRPAP